MNVFILPFLFKRERDKRQSAEDARRRAQRLAREADARARRAAGNPLNIGEPILSSSPEAQANRQTILGV